MRGAGAGHDDAAAVAWLAPSWWSETRFRAGPADDSDSADAAVPDARLGPQPPAAAARQPGPPVGRAQRQARDATAAVLTPLVLGILLCFAGHAGRALLAQRRLDAWDRAWRAVEPRWTQQL